jgi:hypothetical protein
MLAAFNSLFHISTGPTTTTRDIYKILINIVGVKGA